MTVKRSKRAWMRRGRKKQKQSGSDKRYARINKNLIINGDLARAIRKYGITGRDIHVLVTLLAEMQRTKKRTLKFKSTYLLLKTLGWGDSRGEYDAVDSALEKWRKVEVHMDRFYDPAIKKNILQEEAHTDADVLRKKRKTRRVNKHREETYTELLVASYFEDDSLTIAASKKFFRSTNTKVGFFVGAWPDEIRRLRYGRATRLPYSRAAEDRRTVQAFTVQPCRFAAESPYKCAEKNLSDSKEYADSTAP